MGCDYTSRLYVFECLKTVVLQFTWSWISLRFLRLRTHCSQFTLSSSTQPVVQLPSITLVPLDLLRSQKVFVFNAVSYVIWTAHKHEIRCLQCHRNARKTGGKWPKCWTKKHQVDTWRKCAARHIRADPFVTLLPFGQITPTDWTFYWGSWQSLLLLDNVKTFLTALDGLIKRQFAVDLMDCFYCKM